MSRAKSFQCCFLIFSADIEQRAEYPAWAIFKRLGEWPVLEVNWNDKQYSWSNHIVKMMEQGILTDAIIDFGIGTDLKNTSRRILMVKKPQTQTLVNT